MTRLSPPVAFSNIRRCFAVKKFSAYNWLVKTLKKFANYLKNNFDYSYSLTKKDRKVKTHFSIFSKTWKRALENFSGNKSFLFPYVLSITDFEKVVKPTRHHIFTILIYTKRTGQPQGTKKKAARNAQALFIFCCTRFFLRPLNRKSLNKNPAYFINKRGSIKNKIKLH